jgi:predicted nucleotidyltransferase
MVQGFSRSRQTNIGMYDAEKAEIFMQKILCKLKFGSHLYGFATEKSDTDYKGIYLPDINECILGTVKKSINNITKKDMSKKNTADDVDSEIYSLQYAIDLAIKGETVMLDMIHAPKGWEEITSPEWEFIKANRAKFYTKKLKAYIGYVKIQCAKYSIKGSRLEAIERVIKILSQFDPEDRLEKHFDEIQESEYIKKVVIDDSQEQDNRALNVSGKLHTIRSKCGYINACLQKFYDSYGERAKLAKENKGLDFKALSHAMRASKQLEEIYLTGDLKYPLKDAQLLLDIKLGKKNYVKEVAPMLEEMVEKIEVLAKNSKYPEEADKKFWNDWLVSLYVL